MLCERDVQRTTLWERGEAGAEPLLMLRKQGQREQHENGHGRGSARLGQRE